MRLSTRIALLGFAFLALMTAPIQGYAQNVQSIGIVDVQSLLTESSAAKSVQAQITKQRESFQAEISKYERELKDMEAALGKAKTDKNEAEFNKKKEEFEKKLGDTRALVQKRRQALEKAAGDAMQDLRKEIVKITAGIAEEKKIDLVLTRNNVVLADKEMDITQQVMDKLNAEIKEVKLKIETN